MSNLLLNRQSLDNRENQSLAPYAIKCSDSRGRAFPETEHPYRSIFQRDRDRIIHSRAFRRLEYKTQVFVNHEGDHYRTRLTHTLEVDMIGRSIARSLRLNEDLTEALALVHDVGHPPFGHSGEQTLNNMMGKHGGFEHNHQGLRIVELLEKKYPDFDGLNLSWELREGIIKHNMKFGEPESHNYDPDKAPILEVQVVNLADEVAYNSHDLDDGLTSGLFTLNDLSKITIWKETEAEIRRNYPDLGEKLLSYYVVRGIIDKEVQDILNQTQANLQLYGINSVEDVHRTWTPLVNFSPPMAEKNKELKEFLFKNLYSNHQVEIMNQKGIRIIEALFELFINNPRLLDPSTQEKLNECALHRVVCDYIAGMTDRYAFSEYRKLCSLSERYIF